MSNVKHYIYEGRWISLYDDNEINHVITFIYNLFFWSLRDQADRLEYNTRAFIWSRNGKILGTFPITVPEPSPTFVDSIYKVLSVDKFIAEYFMPNSQNRQVFMIKLT